MDVVGFYQPFKIGKLFLQIFWRGVPVGFIISVHFVTEGFFLAVESHGQIVRAFIPYHFLQHVDKPVKRVGGESLGSGKVLPDSEISPENIGRPVYQIEGFFFAH